VVPKRRLPLVVTPDDMAESGRVSGDHSPSAVDEESAESVTVGGRISDGLTASAVLSRHYRTEFPGPGTIVAGFRSSLWHPLQPDREYEVEIGFPSHDPELGRWTSVARVVDMAGETCLLAYSDLLNREVEAP
jgi:hypothetical protein